MKSTAPHDRSCTEDDIIAWARSFAEMHNRPPAKRAFLHHFKGTMDLRRMANRALKRLRKKGGWKKKEK